MEQEKFTKRLNGYTRRVFNDDLDRGDFKYLEVKSWLKDIKSLKALTSLVDFGCNFNDKGQCRVYYSAKTDPNCRCCCNNCYNATGHFGKVQLTDVPKMARLFKAKVGFWRKDEGCILPRELRSSTCVTYICSSYDNSKKNEQSEVAVKQCRAIALAIGVFEEKIRERSIELKLR